MAKSKTRVITKWKLKYKELKARKRIAITTCVVQRKLDERIEELANTLIMHGVNLAEI